MDRYAVLGHPIKHSLSPVIHTAFARQTGEVLEYEAIELPVTSFETRVWQMFRDGYRGFNITAPFKQDAHDFADDLTERAKRARAVRQRPHHSFRCSASAKIKFLCLHAADISRRCHGGLVLLDS